MLISLYLLTILYTNSMGLIIISKLEPLINKKLEEKGYVKKDKTDEEYLRYIIMASIKFLIPGYYLNKALNMSLKENNIDKIIEEKVKNKEIISTYEIEPPEIDSIFKKEDKLSLGKYERPSIYKAIPNESMYTNTRYPNTSEVDMDFWEEEEKDLEPCLESDVEVPKVEIRKEPIEEYLGSISEEELIAMVKQLEIIRKLKKDSESILNS